MKGGVADADREASLDATDFDVSAQTVPADCGLSMEPSLLGKRRLRMVSAAAAIILTKSTDV
jgi:hypothetical protein